jgi:hypothetical protein
MTEKDLEEGNQELFQIYEEVYGKVEKLFAIFISKVMSFLNIRLLNLTLNSPILPDYRQKKI